MSKVLPAACSPHGAGWQSWHSRCRHHWRQLDAKTPGECPRWSGSLTQMLLIFQHPDFPSDLVTLLAAVEATLEVVWKEEGGKERLSNHLNIMTLSTIPIHDSFKHGHRSSNHLPSDWLTISMERKLLRRILLPSLPSTTKLFTHKVEKLKITQVQNVFLFVQVALRTSGAHAYVSCAALLPLEVLLSDVFMEGRFNNFLSAVNTAKSITYMKLLGNILPVHDNRFLS